ncbi:hypothetical protein ABT076_14850 [Streptomyces sp. NPDC002131]|uniref:hypothetical protein n=1 Tax=unclassified Streptomyces TaxID=2593676 RepID=UPI002DD9DEAF|nr:hypothetical protein [Streptomyces sp. NBC_01558]WSD77573.1 hypothetical protein OHB33_15230 [Streptomyces sp. NBC_01558]
MNMVTPSFLAPQILYGEHGWVRWRDTEALNTGKGKVHFKRLRKSTAILIAGAGALALVTVPSPAHATTEPPAAVTASAANPCRSQHYSKVAYNFWIGPRKMPLRCGTQTWGYNHVVARGRWSTSFKNKISDTLFNGYERSPGVYYRYKVGSGCSPNRRKNFKVVVNKGPLGGRPGGLTPQGIITATVEYTIPIVASPSRHKVAC